MQTFVNSLQTKIDEGINQNIPDQLAADVQSVGNWIQEPYNNKDRKTLISAYIVTINIVHILLSADVNHYSVKKHGGRC